MSGQDPRTEPLVRATFGLNALLCAGAWIVWGMTESKLVLAQASDSLLDIAGSAILVVTARVAREPRDEEHPFGHHRAEPIGALVTAILAGVLGFEILRTASGSLLRGERIELDSWVAAILGAKLAVKVGLLAYLALRLPQSPSPAVQAVRVDTRNDVLACCSSLFGFALVRWGFGWADAALAIPIAFLIAYNGVALARENLQFLMGASPDDEVLEESARERRRPARRPVDHVPAGAVARLAPARRGRDPGRRLEHRHRGPRPGRRGPAPPRGARAGDGGLRARRHRERGRARVSRLRRP